MDTSASVAVLLVDRDREQRESCRAFLGRLGCRVDVAASATAALDAIEHDRYDVVVSELSGASDDGVGLWHEVTARHPELRGRFIFCGPGPLPGGAIAAEHLVPKPVDLSVLWLEILVATAWRKRAGL